MIDKVRNQGFTLIEILVVVALIGALFLGILATIDPLEQLKKGTDTARRSLANQIYNGFLTYYADKGSYPWSADIVAVAGTANAVTAANTGYIPTAIAAGEFKSDFIGLSGANLGRIFLTSTADAQGFRTNMSVCFMPDSKSFRLDSSAKYSSSGTAATAGCTVATPCHWCIMN